AFDRDRKFSAGLADDRTGSLDNEDLAVEPRWAGRKVRQIGRACDIVNAIRCVEPREQERAARTPATALVSPPRRFAGKADGVGRTMQTADVIHQWGRQPPALGDPARLCQRG